MKKHQTTIDEPHARELLEEMRAQDVRLAIAQIRAAKDEPEVALLAASLVIVLDELERLQKLAIAPAQAADILTAVFIGSLNLTTREQLKAIRGDTKRPERERPPTARATAIEDARERLRWVEQGGTGFAVIHGHVDSKGKMQVSFVNGFVNTETDNLQQPHGGILLALDAARVLWHEAHGFDVIPEPLPPDLGCKLPPAGWYCSREPGHEGACPARRTG